MSCPGEGEGEGEGSFAETEKSIFALEPIWPLPPFGHKHQETTQGTQKLWVRRENIGVQR